MQSGWDKVTGQPLYKSPGNQNQERYNPTITSFPVSATSVTFPSVLPTVNPGLVNYNQARHPQQYFQSSSPSNGDNPAHSSQQSPPADPTQTRRSAPAAVQQISSTPMSGTPGPPPMRIGTTTNIAIHPLLTSNTRCSRQPMLAFDVSKSPTLARVLTSANRYVALPLDRSLITEISPGDLRHCILTFDCENLRTHVLDISNLALEDFLSALHYYFDESLSNNELRQLQSSLTRYERVVEAMNRRCSAASNPGQEWAKGVKRVDCLEDRTWFLGMQVLSDSDQSSGDVWFRVTFMQRAW